MRDLSFLIRSTTILALLFALSSRLSVAQTLKYNPGDELRFGVGYNTLTGQYAGNCTVDVSKEDIKPAGSDEPNPGQLTKYELSSVQDLSSLSEKLDFSASASASFVAGSVSASTQYVRTRSFNTFHQFLFLDATVANATQVWTKPALMPDKLKLRQQNPLEFFNQCGDSFVKTITEGGELTAVLDISTSAQEDASSLSIAISGDYSTAQGQLALRNQLQSTLLNRQTKVNIMRAGGSQTLPSFSADELIAASLTFPASVAQHPYPMLAKLASYNTIAQPMALTTKQEAFIGPLFRVYKKAMQYLGDLAYVRSHTSEFRIISVAQAANVAPTGPLKVPQTQNLADWQAYGEAKAADPTHQLSILLENKQTVLSGDFTLADIKKDAVDQVIDNWESLTDQLISLARGCVSDPGNGCTGTIPSQPARIVNLVRIFPVQKDWNTAAGPVSITLEPSYICQVDTILGNWRIGDAANAPILACNASLPNKVTNGYIITGGFDSYYQDNHGSCTYLLTCYRR